MPRNISFSLTTDQVRDQSKTVTRRLGWKFLRVGDILNACVKCQGLKPGEKIERLGQIRVVDVRREPLDQLTMSLDGGYGEVVAEGFPDMTGEMFCEMFADSMHCDMDTEITRIEFEYLLAQEQ